MKAIFWFVPAFMVFIGILLLSTIFSIQAQIEGVEYVDKLQHAFAYAVLILTFLFACLKNELLTLRIWIILILSSASYGILLELVQYTFFPNRYFEWWDAVANVSGVLIGSFLFRLFVYVK